VAAASAVFIFTPQARSFAGSAFFLPTLLTGVGTFALHAAGHGLLTGSVSPLVRGLTGHYSRENQPKRFWASIFYNAVLGGSLLAMAPLAYADGKRSRCMDRQGVSSAEVLEACSSLLDDKALSVLDRHRALLVRGRNHAELGNYEQAMLDYDRAIHLDNTDSEAFYLRALLYERRGHDQLANEDFNSAILLDPDVPRFRLARGVFYINRGNLYGARQDLNRADALDPDNAWILANRGVTEAWLQNFPAARRDLDAARALDPDNRVVLSGGAIVKFQTGDLPGALRDIETLLRMDPGDQWANGFRGEITRKLEAGRGRQGARPTS
jgi:Flp pilus assembly protein TadD